MTVTAEGLSLAPFRALRPTVDDDRLARLLCPPYDVIDDEQRARLLAADAQNLVAVVLPRGGDDRYRAAAETLSRQVHTGLLAVDPDPALYVYEMRTADGAATRGLLGAVELRAPDDGVILPHENTMAGPVADRLALMTATEANVEPIYLVYDGGGPASEMVRSVADDAALCSATTPDGTMHRLWALAKPDVHAEVTADLADRRAVIADGHHRYATYLQLQQEFGAARGPGPWDRGLTLLVDSSSYGPQVHAIHRVIRGLRLGDALAAVTGAVRITPADDPIAALAELDGVDGFAAVLTDGSSCAVLSDPDPALVEASGAPDDPRALAGLDVNVLHRGLVGRVWGLPDTENVVGYAHSTEDAIAAARASGGVAVLLRPTPVPAVAAVAAAGARMPRKSTLFTPKPASGLVMRRFADQTE